MSSHFGIVCYVNVHKRCQNNVANNCGINARQLADILNDMGMTPHQLSARPKPNARTTAKVLELSKYLWYNASRHYFMSKLT